MRSHQPRVVRLVALSLLAVVALAASVGPVASPAVSQTTDRWLPTSRSASMGDDGPLLRFTLKVEQGTGYDPDQFATEAVAILGDPRSWIGVDGRQFELVAGGSTSSFSADREADFTIFLATPRTADRLCFPLRTVGRLSCRNGNRVVINHDRWMRGPDVYHQEFAGALDTYRQYVINHEVGHRLGRGHQNINNCRSDLYAPVMMQQTFRLRGCAINGWPAWDRLSVGTGSEPPPPEPPPSGACDPVEVFPWTDTDRPLDDAVLRLYAAGFGRLPDDEGLRYWTGLVANGTSLDTVAGAFLDSPEGRARFGGADDPAFVDAVYRTVLGRDPDDEGRAFWLEQLLGGALVRAEVLRQLADSSENVTRTGTVRPQHSAAGWLGRLYGVVFERRPDCEGARFWLWSLSSVSESEVINQFLASPEFNARYGALDDDAFVSELYRRVLERDPDPEGLAFWRTQLESGRLTRVQLVRAWLDSAELILRSGSMP